MPAIDLIRLRAKINLLMEVFNNPSLFISGLREIYSVYSDRTHPLADFHAEIHSQPAFNTPVLLNRELLDTFLPFCSSQPDRLIEILELLWAQPEVEMRQLAALLLGNFPLTENDKVISHIIRWSSDQKDALLLPYLHEHGSLTLRREDPLTWLRVLETWKLSGETWQIKLSIQGIISLIDDRDFKNLPAIFTFIIPFFNKLDSNIQFDLRVALEHLARRSEVETVYFLKQLISSSVNPDFERFIRRTINIFSPEMQSSLRQALRERNSY